MTARECIAPLAARLRTALADEKQRVNLLVLMGLAGLVLLAFPPGCRQTMQRSPPPPPRRRRPPTTPPSWKTA